MRREIEPAAGGVVKLRSNVVNLLIPFRNFLDGLIQLGATGCTALDRRVRHGSPTLYSPPFHGSWNGIRALLGPKPNSRVF